MHDWCWGPEAMKEVRQVAREGSSGQTGPET